MTIKKIGFYLLIAFLLMFLIKSPGEAAKVVQALSTAAQQISTYALRIALYPEQSQTKEI